MCSKCKVNEKVNYSYRCKLCLNEYQSQYRRTQASKDARKAYLKTSKSKEYQKEHRREYRRRPYVYKVMNISDGTIYYGHSTKQDRWATHKNHALSKKCENYKSPFFNAIRSACKDKSEVETHFKFEILGYTETKAEARALELHLIKKAIERGQAIYNSSKANR